MLEWLSGDPLVGILTTIGFFTFLIIGRQYKLYRITQKGNVDDLHFNLSTKKEHRPFTN